MTQSLYMQAAQLPRGSYFQLSATQILAKTPSDTLRDIRVEGEAGDFRLTNPCWGASASYATPQAAIAHVLERDLHWRRCKSLDETEVQPSAITDLPCPATGVPPGKRSGRQLWQLAKARVMPIVQGFRVGAEMMYEGYWLEPLVFDGRHIYGKDLHAEHPRWRDTPHAPASFQAWVTNLPQEAQQHMRTMRYLDAEQARMHAVACDAGRLVYRHRPTPAPVATAWGQALVAALTPDDELRVIPYVMGHAHHSTLTGGGPVLAAGEIITDAQGTLREVTDKSGHYRVDHANHRRMLTHLRRIGILTAASDVVFRRQAWLPTMQVLRAWDYLQTLDRAADV